HARYPHVVDKRFLTERLLQPAEPRHRSTDAVAVTVAVAPDECGIPLQPELFAEELVPPRFGSRQLATILCRLTCGLNGIDNPAIARAAAYMPIEHLGNRGAVGRFSLLDQ